VHINDVAFSVHAVLLTGVTLMQCYLYRNNNGDDDGERIQQARPATATVFAVSLAVIVSFIWAGLILVTPTVDPPPDPCTKASCPPESLLTWISFIYFLSGIKFLVTLVKYIPQVVLNCQRQSTKGWNVWNVLLDFEGGSLSLIQQIIDALVDKSWIPLIGSPIKFGLSLVSMVFDVIFIVQHFVLYPNWKRKLASDAMAADYARIANAS
jgi:cystinosin